MPDAGMRMLHNCRACTQRSRAPMTHNILRTSQDTDALLFTTDRFPPLHRSAEQSPKMCCLSRHLLRCARAARRIQIKLLPRAAVHRNCGVHNRTPAASSLTALHDHRAVTKGTPAFMTWPGTHLLTSLSLASIASYTSSFFSKSPGLRGRMCMCTCGTDWPAC